MAVWFRNGGNGGNLNAATRWNDKADGSGNNLTWANLAAGDVLCANGRTGININTGFTCLRISNAAEVGSSDTGTAGGTFNIIAAYTLICNVLADTVNCLYATGTGYTWVLQGDAQGGGSTNAYGVDVQAANTLTMTGRCLAGAGTGAVGLYLRSGSVATVTGNPAGSGTNGRGIQVLDGATLTLYGNPEGGSGAPTANGVYNGNATAGAVVIVGNILNTVGKANGVGGYSVDWRPAASNYSRWQSNGSTIDAPQGLPAGSIKAGVVSGTVTGTHGSAPLVGIGGLVG